MKDSLRVEDHHIEVGASILAADFAHLADEAKKAEEAGADYIHVDIMDGHFVPNLSMGPSAVAALKRNIDLFIDVHLMIYNPFDYIERFVEAGADRITFHFEATEDVLSTLEYIQRCNVQAGLAFSPSTSESFIVKYLDRCDLLLLMTVEPGFGGQPFLNPMLEKISFARKMCNDLGVFATPRGKITKQSKGEPALLPIQVDGGIDEVSAALCKEAGASSFVSGSYLFNHSCMRDAIQTLRGAPRRV